MNDKDVSSYIADILQVIDRIESILTRHDYESFSDDFTIRMATERGLEIISEASCHLPAAYKEREPGISWRDVANLGDILRHPDREVTAETLWKICQQHLGPLREAVLRMQRQARQP